MELAELLAEREIYRKLVAFSRAMDDRDWPVIDTLATADMTADFGLGEIVGRAAVVASIRSFLDVCGPTQHLLGSIVIDVDGDTASSKAYVSDLHLGAEGREELTFRTLGDYHDSWRKVDGEWRLYRRVKHNRATVGSMDVFRPAGQD